MTSGDENLARLLLERGLLTPEEHSDAVAACRASRRPLADVLIEKAYLDRVQIESAVAALQSKIRFCVACRKPVLIPRVAPGRELCPRCLGPLEWRAERSAEWLQDLDQIVDLARDALPPDVARASADPSRLFGKYVLLQEAGEGGIGVVHQAWDTMLGRYVALKFIREPHGMDRQQRAMLLRDFLQEARAAVGLRHPNIVQVFDIDRVDDQYFIAMEYVEGVTLGDHILAAQQRERLSCLYEAPTFYLRVLRDVAGAVHYAHSLRRPIVHCDLKPGNVLIGPEGTAYVMDFGLARILGAGVPDEDRVRGTPAYMSPEQATGRAGDIGPWTDVYGLGGILYELLTGRAMFDGDPGTTLARVLSEAPARPTEIIHEAGEERHSSRVLSRVSKLEMICLRCLQKSPADRYRTARDVAAELDAVVSALEAGDVGTAPETVVRAQERAEAARIDGHLSGLEIEEAQSAAEEAARHRGTRAFEERRLRLPVLAAFRERLVARINRDRPSLDRLEAGGRTREGVRLVSATLKGLVVLHGQDVVDVALASVPAAQLAAIARAVGLDGPEDRLAMAIVCHHAGAAEMALSLAKSLEGTPLEAQARALLAETRTM